MQNFNAQHISPEKGENMPSTYLVSQPESSNGNKGEVTHEVICCNKDLVKRFQLPAERTLEIGHSAHYLKKAFHCVAENARSLSLPSFGNKNNCENHNADNCNEESRTLSQNGNDNSGSDNSSVKCPDDSWFRTWPERGYDRLVNGHISDNSDYTGKCDEAAPIGNSCKCHTSSNLSSPVSQKNCKCNLNNSVTMSAQNNGVDVCGCNVSDLRKEQNSSIPLNELLQNIPLAYSPVTRQLHVINQDSPTKVPLNLCDKSDFEQKQFCKLDRTENHSAGQFETDFGKSHSRSGSNSDTFPSIEDAVSYESPRSTLQRFGVYGTSLFKTDTSSFSSIVSSLSDVSPSTNEDSAAGNLLDPDSISIACSGNESLDCSEHNALFEDSGAKPKRRGISGFFSRNVFGWKSRDTHNSSSNNTQVWRLFSKASCKPSEQEEGVRCVPDSPVSIRSTGSGSKRYEDVVASSSALILHDRPSNLPAKSLDEDIKHRLEYQNMVEAARKKEMKEAKLRKKQMQQQLKFEEQLANAARIWSNEILPKWDLMKNSRKARDLWWSGIPPSVRGKVWKLALGNDLNITHELYEICVARSQELLKAAENGNSLEHQLCNDKSPDEFKENPDKESSVELIQLDISRTFPHLCIFQKGGPYYDILHSMLGAYVCYRPDVGYVQGMSFIAAVLILNMEPADAFICFANLLNQPCHMVFFRLNQEMMQAYYAAYNDFFQENLPRLFAHFTESSLSADLYLLDWLYTIFAKAMPLDVACRVWDIFLRDGEEFLFKTALGVLHLNQESLIKLDFIHGAQFLTKLPDDMAADKLFKSIEAIKMNVGKQKFSEVLAYHVEQLCGDGSS